MQFIKERTDGFVETLHTASAYTAEKAEEISGIPAADLVKAASIFGLAGRGAIVYAMGVTQHFRGTDIVQALANLALVTGNVGREGTGVYPLRGHAERPGGMRHGRSSQCTLRIPAGVQPPGPGQIC